MDRIIAVKKCNINRLGFKVGAVVVAIYLTSKGVVGLKAAWKMSGKKGEGDLLLGGFPHLDECASEDIEKIAALANQFVEDVMNQLGAVRVHPRWKRHEGS